jgi:hypothetical protein
MRRRMSVAVAVLVPYRKSLYHHLILCKTMSMGPIL